jgi:hypothetical protein
MSDNIEFNSASELYNRVLPALYSKVRELNNLGFRNVNERDIWSYLVNTEWKEKVDLQLNDIISDILYCDNNKLNDYVNNRKNYQKSEIVNIMEDGGH